MNIYKASEKPKNRGTILLWLGSLLIKSVCIHTSPRAEGGGHSAPVLAARVLFRVMVWVMFWVKVRNMVMA